MNTIASFSVFPLQLRRSVTALAAMLLLAGCAWQEDTARIAAETDAVSEDTTSDWVPETMRVLDDVIWIASEWFADDEVHYAPAADMNPAALSADAAALLLTGVDGAVRVRVTLAAFGGDAEMRLADLGGEELYRAEELGLIAVSIPVKALAELSTVADVDWISLES